MQGQGCTGGEEGRFKQPDMKDSPGEVQDGDLKIDGSGDWLPAEPPTLPAADDKVCDEDAGTDEESEAVKNCGPCGLVGECKQRQESEAHALNEAFARAAVSSSSRSASVGKVSRCARPCSSSLCARPTAGWSGPSDAPATLL